MKQFIIAKVVICALSFGGVLYAYLEQQNDLTKLKACIPVVAREVHYLEEEVTRLAYEIDRFENPKHLLELAKRPEFSHLKYPMVDEIIVLKKKDLPHFYGDSPYTAQNIQKRFAPLFIGSTLSVNTAHQE